MKLDADIAAEGNTSRIIDIHRAVGQASAPPGFQPEVRKDV